MAKKSTVRIKPGDTLDIAPKVEAAVSKEKLSVAEAKKQIEEIQSTERPELPRWGDKGPLTIASPGSIVPDPLYIPEYVDVNDGTTRRVALFRVIRGQRHTLTADGQRKFRWCKKDSQRIAIHKSYGYRFSSYSSLFANTGLFEQGPGDMVLNGDLVLMEISLDGWERLHEEKMRLQLMLEGSHINDLAAEGERYGVPTFVEDRNRGVREFLT